MKFNKHILKQSTKLIENNVQVAITFTFSFGSTTPASSSLVLRKPPKEFKDSGLVSFWACNSKKIAMYQSQKILTPDKAVLIYLG